MNAPGEGTDGAIPFVLPALRTPVWIYRVLPNDRLQGTADGELRMPELRTTWNPRSGLLATPPPLFAPPWPAPRFLATTPDAHSLEPGFYCWRDEARCGVRCVAAGRVLQVIALRNGEGALYTDGYVALEVDHTGRIFEARMRAGSPANHTLSTMIPAFARHLIQRLGAGHPLFTQMG